MPVCVHTIVHVWSYISVCMHVCAPVPGNEHSQLHLFLHTGTNQIWVCLCVNTIVHMFLYMSVCTHLLVRGTHAHKCGHTPTLLVTTDVHWDKSVHGFVHVKCMHVRLYAQFPVHMGIDVIGLTHIMCICI